MSIFYALVDSAWCHLRVVFFKSARPGGLKQFTMPTITKQMNDHIFICHNDLIPPVGPFRELTNLYPEPRAKEWPK